MSDQPPFNFDILDTMDSPRILAATPDSIGPLVELAWLKSKGHSCPSLSDLSPTMRIQAFLKAMDCEEFVQVQRGTLSAGFIRTLWSEEEADKRLQKVFSAAQAAAIRAGVTLKVAQELIGAIGELEDNIRLHSEKQETGLIGFSAVPGKFEFVIADKGIGVLKSLRSSPVYESVSDHGAALYAAVKEGASRLGRGEGHGQGFRQLFVGLYNLRSFLRFRSGDCALVLDGRGEGKTELTRIAPIDGLLTSVVCQS